MYFVELTMQENGAGGSDYGSTATQAQSCPEIQYHCGMTLTADEEDQLQEEGRASG